MIMMLTAVLISDTSVILVEHVWRWRLFQDAVFCRCRFFSNADYCITIQHPAMQTFASCCAEVPITTSRSSDARVPYSLAPIYIGMYIRRVKHFCDLGMWTCKRFRVVKAFINYAQIRPSKICVLFGNT